ncbi:MAG: hypothetical protein Tsb0015_13290 [Simkaniaceae bacterium]
MKSKYFSAISLLALGTFAMSAEAKEEKIGIVNFATCITESKYGKQEQEAFESIKTQMTSLIEDSEKQLNEIAAKFNDPDYMDGLSPEGEQELKAKFQSLQEEMARYQQQYYQLINQANYKLVQTMSNYIQSASKSVAQKKKLDYVINKDAVFFYNTDYDITSEIIQEMNKDFDKAKQNNENASKAAAVSAPSEKKD